MRRKFLYLLISILAFEFGVLIFIKIYQQNEFEHLKTETGNVFEGKSYSSEDNKIKQPKFVQIKLKDLPCEDEILQIVWKDLTAETASINVERAERIKNCGDIIEIAPADEPTDLNGDGKEEIIIRGYMNPFSRCGNNCDTYWIFQKISDKKYRKLFESEGYLPVVKNEKHQGYKNILFEVYMREFESRNVLYEFNGIEYVPSKCWSKSKLYESESGDLVEGKKWRTEYQKCEESGYIMNYRKPFDSQ